MLSSVFVDFVFDVSDLRPMDDKGTACCRVPLLTGSLLTAQLTHSVCETFIYVSPFRKRYDTCATLQDPAPFRFWIGEARWLQQKTYMALARSNCQLYQVALELQNYVLNFALLYWGIWGRNAPSKNIFLH